MNFSKTWLTVLAAFGGGIIGSMLMQAPAPVEAQNKADSVVASEFVLRGKDGNTRARLGLNEAGATTLQLYDHNGDESLRLTASAQSSGMKYQYARIECFTKDEKVKAQFGVGTSILKVENDHVEAQSAGLSFRQEGGDVPHINEIWMGADVQKSSYSARSSRNRGTERGEILQEVGVGGESVSFWHDGMKRLNLTTDSSGSTSIQLKDKKEETVWSQSSR